MASTNSTTHYELSQYIGTDKPTYLVDYNQDMSKIDAGIYAAKSEADTNSGSIGTLSSLTTTAKNNLVAAINEVDAESSSIGDLTTLTTTAKTSVVSAINEVNSETSSIGTIANLTTSTKTDLVSAINEVDGDVGTLSSLATTSKSNLVSAINEVNTNTNNNTSNLNKFNLTNIKTYSGSDMTSDVGSVQNYSSITVATNSDGSIGKVYGTIYTNYAAGGSITVTIASTDLRPSSNITINNAVIYYLISNTQIIGCHMNVKTNGNIEFLLYASPNQTAARFTAMPSLYFLEDFGDVPTI